MHIILVSDRMATAKSITLSARHAVAAVVGLVGSVLLVSSLAPVLTLRYVEQIPLPFVQELVYGQRYAGCAQAAGSRARESRRHGKQAGRDAGTHHPPGFHWASGCPSSPASSRRRFVTVPCRRRPRAGRVVHWFWRRPRITENDVQRQIDTLSRQVEWRGDYLGLVETQVLDERARQKLLPTTLPIAGAWDASSFGWRKDPFTGQRALHEGVDFSADSGTPIKAAASGVVIMAERHSSYGNVVEIDHGDGLTTRYAHASKLLVTGGGGGEARAGDCRGRFHRPLDRPPPALRSPRRWRGAEPKPFPGGGAQRRHARGARQVSLRRPLSAARCRARTGRAGVVNCALFAA